jgi:Tfp pilus assembly protein PilV
MGCRRTRRDAAHGFTILDTMVAAMVMIIAVVGLLSLQLTQVGSTVRARQLSEATALLQQTLEEVRLQPVPAAAYASAPETVDARGCPAPPGPGLRWACQTGLVGDSSGTRYTRSFRVTPSLPGQAQVQVEVTWTDPDGKEHKVEISHAR